MKKLFAILLAAILMVSSIPFAAFAETAEMADTAGDITYVAFASDVHEEYTSLEEWLSGVSENYGQLEQVGICGDLIALTVWDNAKAVKNTLEILQGPDGSHEYVKRDGFIICGNHDRGLLNGFNESTGYKYYKKPGTVEEVPGKYIMYSMGATQYLSKYKDSDIDELKSYLKSIDTDVPVFILGHFPLHYMDREINSTDDGIFGGAAAEGTAKLISSINEAIDYQKETNDRDLDVYFIWGHNHDNSDPYYNTVYDGHFQGYDLKFKYLAAGATTDLRRIPSTIAQGLVIGIQGGKVISIDYTDGEGDPFDPEYCSDDETPSIYLTAESTEQSISLTANVGDTVKIGLVNGNNLLEYSFKSTFDKEGIASVISTDPDPLKIDKNCYGVVEIEALQAGETKLSFAGSTNLSSTKLKASVNITVKAEDDDPADDPDDDDPSDDPSDDPTDNPPVNPSDDTGGGTGGGSGSGGSGSGGSGGSKNVSQPAGTYSQYWVSDAAGNWRVYNRLGQPITNCWLCDDAVAANGQNIWYLMQPDGTMLSAGLVQDNTGNFYSLETNHNGYFGMLRYNDGWYNCNGIQVYLQFNRTHNGAFGAVINPDGLSKLQAIYGVTRYNVGNDRLIYTSMF